MRPYRWRERRGAVPDSAADVASAIDTHDLARDVPGRQEVDDGLRHVLGRAESAQRGRRLKVLRVSLAPPLRQEHDAGSDRVDAYAGRERARHRTRHLHDGGLRHPMWDVGWPALERR